jgi:P4 family phage/plasmid primase-like protien
MKFIKIRFIKPYIDGKKEGNKHKVGEIVDYDARAVSWLVKEGYAEYYKEELSPEEQYYKNQDNKEQDLKNQLWTAQDRIPKQYRTEKARFIKIDMTDPENKQWKKPLEKDWTNTRNYPYNDIKFLQYLATGDNYGIALGYDDIGVLDADHLTVDQTARKELPDSFRIRTGGNYYDKPEYGRKIHFVFRVPGWTHGTVNFDDDAGGNHLGEFRWQGAMVIAPGSKHYKTGNTYEIENDVPIATITPEQLYKVIEPFMKGHNERTEIKKDNDNSEKKCDIDITKVLKTSDFTGQTPTEEANGIYRGKHPGHDSSTNRNFQFSINTNLWYCQRHGTGGGTLELIAVKHGIIKCENCKKTKAKPEILSGGENKWDDFKAVVKIAKEKYGIELPKKENQVGNITTKVLIPDLPRILKKEDYYEEDKFKAPRLARDICFNDGHNRGLHVMTDNQKIIWDNGRYWQDNGEELLRDVTQQILGDGACLRHKNETLGWIKDNVALHLDRKQLDFNKYKIGLQNGVYDLQSHTLMPFAREHLITSLLPFKYNPEAKCPGFLKFMSETLEESDITVIQEMFGYCFRRDYRLSTLFFLVGVGRNGKSTLLNVLTALLGEENISNVSIQSLCDENFSKIRLYHKYANIIADLTTRELEHTGQLKQLTGNDTIQARDIYEKPIQFLSYAKLISAMNQIPVCHDNSPAWLIRCICIEFPYQFLDGAEGTDKNLIDKLTTPDEIEGIFNWAMEGYKRLETQGSFSKHMNLKDMDKFMAQTKNAILQFVTHCVKSTPLNEVLKDDVYKAYLKYAKDNELTTVGSKHFSPKFKDYLMEKEIEFGQGHVTAGKTWKGIEIIKQDDPKEEKKCDVTKEKQPSPAVTKENKLVIAAGIDKWEEMHPDEVQEMVDNE